MSSATELVASEELRRYIEATGENGIVDAKSAMKWDDIEVKASLARDIVAFANSEGGGAIVIGKKELDDGSFEIEGLSEEQSASFDTTAVADFIIGRFEPSFSFTCHRVQYEGKRVVVIQVSEFEELPAICVKECHIAGKGKLIERGEIIVRTKAGGSTKLQTRDQWSALVSRALLKRGDQLREIIDRVVTGRTAENKPTDEARFTASLAEVEATLKDDMQNDSKLGAWRFFIHGEEFERKWNSAADLIAMLERDKVTRWHGFPGRCIRPQPTEWGVAEGGGNRTIWGMTYEGLLYSWEDYSENHASFRSPWRQMGSEPGPDVPAGSWMESVWNIYHICMFADFAAKYSAEFAASSPLRFSIEASGLKGRQLLCTDPMVSIADAGDYAGSNANVFSVFKNSSCWDDPGRLERVSGRRRTFLPAVVSSRTANCTAYDREMGGKIRNWSSAVVMCVRLPVSAIRNRIPMPRPRFTLRVMLVATAIAAVVAWQVGAVVQRRWALTSGHVFIFAREAPGDPDPEKRQVNAFRSLLGDEPVRFIYVEPKAGSQRTIDGLKRLFPEAQIVASY